MSDFAQAGLICTLQRFNDTHLPALEAELESLVGERPIALVLPCHASELHRPALAHVCGELAGARWLDEIVVSMNGLAPTGFAQAKEFFSRLPQRVRVLWNDGPRVSETHRQVLGDVTHGKGLNVWAAAGLLCTEGRAAILATQDCDVASFRRSTLARLCYAAAHPELGFEFAKMYYSRVTDRLYGRVSRLFFAPLLQAILRVAGHRPLLDFLLSFRYPLAGEVALTRDLMERLPFANGWALEVGMLCEVFRRLDPQRVCQVDGGTGYDHKHRPMSPGSGLTQMCAEITGALLGEMRTEGLELNPGTRAALSQAYRRASGFAMRRSAALALINGLPFAREQEQELVDAFCGVLEGDGASAPATLPSWESVRRTHPDAGAELAAAVEADARP